MLRRSLDGHGGPGQGDGDDDAALVAALHAAGDDPAQLRRRHDALRLVGQLLHCENMLARTAA